MNRPNSRYPLIPITGCPLARLDELFQFVWRGGPLVKGFELEERFFYSENRTRAKRGCLPTLAEFRRAWYPKAAMEHRGEE